MPDTADHRVEMHRLAAQRRRQGKPIWDRKIRLADVFHNDSLTFEQKRDAIVKRIRDSGWLDGKDEFDDLVMAVEELAETAEAGNAVIRALHPSAEEAHAAQQALCIECCSPAPCDTRKALDAALDGSKEETETHVEP